MALEGASPNLAWSSERYQLRERVGSGGMSQVFRAWDRQLDREVAIKVLHPHLASSDESRKRFSREARAVAKLHHPQIVEIFDFSGDGEAAFIVTEFIRGQTLRAFVEGVGFGLPQLSALAAHSLCLALEHAHAAGIVHRDLKPENVMVSAGGTLKLMDFGIARIIDQGDKMTMTGAMVGSPAYMAPEIIEGKEAIPSSDLFSFGTLLYWLLTGALPFDAPNTTALLRRVLETEHRDARSLNATIPDSLAALLRSLLARDPAARPPSAAAVRQALEASLAEDGLTDPPAELRAFLADPPGYRERFRSALLVRLREAAQTAMRAGRASAALRDAGRVLALEPTDALATQILTRVSTSNRRRQRLRQAAGVALVFVAVGAGVAGIQRFALVPRPRLTPLPVAPPLAPVAATVPGPSPATPPAAILHAASATALRPPINRSRAAAPFRAAIHPTGPAHVDPVDIRYEVRPYGDVSVDGKPVAMGSDPSGALSLAPGLHHFVFQADSYEPFATDVQVAPGVPAIRVRLQPKPAHLRIQADPRDASVMVDDQPRGVAADSEAHPIVYPFPANRPEGTAVVRVFKPGYRDLVQQIRLRANEDKVVPAKLAPEGAP